MIALLMLLKLKTTAQMDSLIRPEIMQCLEKFTIFNKYLFPSLLIIEIFSALESRAAVRDKSGTVIRKEFCSPMSRL